MQRLSEHCALVIRKIIWIGFGIQIVLGVLWMCNAFVEMSDFGKGIVCVGQIILLGAAVLFAFSRAGRLAGKELFVLASILTFPMIMQCLITPDARVLTAAFLLFAWGCLVRIKEKMIGSLFGTCLTVFLILAGAASLLLPEAKTDFSARIAGRVIWTTLYHEFDFLPQDKQDLIDYDVLTESTYEAVGLETILIPDMDETLGKEQSRELLGEMISLTWEYSRNRVIKEIAWDEAGYLVPPLILPLQLSGRAYESYAGINYRQMLSVAPGLSSVYMRFGCVWFLFALVMRFILVLLNGAAAGFRRFFDIAAKRASILYGGVSVILISAWYTLNSAGRMDYKNSLYILCVWLIWIAGVNSGENLKENSGEKNMQAASGLPDGEATDEEIR